MPSIFTIPPGIPFLDTLADALVSGRLVGPVGDDPFALASVTLYLPTRRATRALGAVLAQRLGRAALLPRMIPLGEADEAELDLASGPLDAEAAAALHPPIPPLERRLILTRLVQAWARTVDRQLIRLDDDVPFSVPSSPADAVALAGDLERLMDAITVEGLPWADLGAAVEAEHSRYFGLTLDFLKIAAENWPKILAERGLSDPVARSRLLMQAEAKRLARERPADPVIVAGSTGSVPATAELITAVAGLPRGAIVLPGLDRDLDEAGWAAIETGEGETAHGHPQAILHRLLGKTRLGIAREAVEALGTPDETAQARQRVLSQALRPAETTDAWARLDPAERIAAARLGLQGLAVVEAADEREEALVIALALRETLERPGATAALVTPDRQLSARVAAELRRWGIEAEDSAGESLAQSSAGRFARLAAELATEIAPARVIALLAHPLVRLGLTRSEVVRGAAALEIGVLRGPAPRPGFEGMREAVRKARGATDRVPRARKRLGALDWELAETLVERLTDAFGQFAGNPNEACDLVETVARHRAACERLIEGPPDGSETADEPSLAMLDALLDDLAFASRESLPGRFSDYPAFFTALARERSFCLPQGQAHPRVKILGLLEARLLDADRVVLGGLDEGVWPGRASTDAFLNRPMRERVGLNPPERRIGQTAHDFVQSLGCRDAVITRAAKRGGSPTVPSRFLQRLRAFSGEAVWESVLALGRRYRAYAAALDRGTARTERPKRPAPKPDPALFPERLSVTEVETLVRDPYAIFARHVLKLDPLDPLATRPGPSERGTLIHGILERFTREHPNALPRDAAQRLTAIAVAEFGPLNDEYPEIYAEWFPRYERMAVAFLRWESERRGGLTRIHTEKSGRWVLPLGKRRLTLTGRADRIEEQPGGGFTIVDYKTGTPPSNKEVFVGFSPQLTLEAAMLQAGAFDGLKAEELPELLYVHASGGREPFRLLPVKPPRDETRTLAAIVEEHVQRLTGLVARFHTGEAAYVSRPYPQYARDYGAYDHLARVLEWSLAGEEL